MKIFLASPTRNISDEFRGIIQNHVRELESQGHEVYYPARDTNQDDNTGFDICLANRAAICNADEVYVIWDSKSQGVLFDLGMAFAMRKSVRVLRVPFACGKSFENTIRRWEQVTTGPEAVAAREVAALLGLTGERLFAEMESILHRS